jgi:hypothetical protein
MQAMREMEIPLPEALSTPAEYVLNADLRRLMEAPDADLETLRKIAAEYEAFAFKPDGETLGYAVSRWVGSLVAAWAARPDNVVSLEKIEAVLTILEGLGVGFDLWQSQNIFFSTGKALYGRGAPGAGSGPLAAPEWVRAFKAVAELLHIDPSAFTPPKPA